MVQEFQKVLKEYNDQVEGYRKEMEAESKEKNDCVGDKSTKCKLSAVATLLMLQQSMG
jgi:hypothetical protein